MSGGNSIVALEPNSLYIATNQIIADFGKFHWAFYLTDAAGEATKIHWADLPIGSPNAEGLVVTPLHPVQMYTNAVATFAFFRIGGFHPPPQDVLMDVLANVFEPPETLGYRTVMMNRKRGLTCRTWAMRVYEKLRALGYIER